MDESETRTRARHTGARTGESEIDRPVESAVTFIVPGCLAQPRVFGYANVWRSDASPGRSEGPSKPWQR